MTIFPSCWCHLGFRSIGSLLVLLDFCATNQPINRHKQSISLDLLLISKYVCEMRDVNFSQMASKQSPQQQQQKRKIMAKNYGEKLWH